MRLVKARVQNYRSIVDTGEFEIDQIKTVMVGINEAGKSAILKALHSINPGSKLDEPNLLRDYPRAQYSEYVNSTSPDELGDTPLATGYFKLDENDVQDFIESNDLEEFSDFDFSSVTYIYERNYKSNTDSLKYESDSLCAKHEDIRVSLGKLGLKLAENEVSKPLADEINAYAEGIINQKSYIPSSNIGTLLSILNQSELHVEDEKHINLIEELKSSLVKSRASYLLQEYCKKNLPKFVYFSDYIKVKPIIHLGQLADRQRTGAIIDNYYDYGNICLLKYIGYTADELHKLGEKVPNQTDLEAIREKLDDRHYKLNAAGIALSKKIKEIWNPDHRKDEASKVRIVADADYLKLVVVDEEGVEVELNQRSDGFQWMVSFFIVFASQSDKDHKNSVLLLDEPATSLHALKQMQFIKTISKLAENNQTIYTTHSPFLIAQNELDKVRIVELIDRSIGTKVNGKIVSSDPAALFPLQEALGYNLAQSMFTNSKNVLLEGLTDLWYLEGFCATSDETLNGISLMPTGSSSKIIYYANILTNNELKAVALLDSDAAGDNAANQEILIEKLQKKNILRTSDFCNKQVKNSAIEDVVRETLAKLYSENFDLKFDINSEDYCSKSIVEILKIESHKAKIEFNKYQLAKLFLGWAREHTDADLNSEESEHVKKLLDTIKAKLK